ncbi:uncharacterized protein N7482_009533 [Penicillium canariense]|uniref:Uncharacterized protein n=1 Tax=Penicillium canariense TaxID=189055 RepID=A0A9W9HR13_9EURO|nr:uncharacterized protein N7482_009533 [Penicillium canariense]KAJ5153055.1 hypothetical protein N7482_009533 [Penicillium canariense]
MASTRTLQVKPLTLQSLLEPSGLILQQHPFADTQIIVSTQHCMQLLCSTVRRLMNPDFPYTSSDHWVSLLRSTSTLGRIVNFFVAIANDDERKEDNQQGSSWSHRK